MNHPEYVVNMKADHEILVYTKKRLRSADQVEISSTAIH